MLRKCHARHPQGPETIIEAAQRLFQALFQSKSSRAVFKEAGDSPRLLPGANGNSRVLGVCMPSDDDNEASLFIHNQQPDTVISIFNSPFGPDVLVVTDRLSEGIDLHRYCRHLVHYELDPSPIRTVQRNGRLRRVNSWAAVTSQNIRYAYPAFQGTRDHRLVQIMKKRINSFSLLLGGVQDFDVDDVAVPEEAWRNQVVTLAKDQLASAGRPAPGQSSRHLIRLWRPAPNAVFARRPSLTGNVHVRPSRNSIRGGLRSTGAIGRVTHRQTGHPR